MVSVAQLVRAPGCGPGGRGFDSPRSPFFRLIRCHGSTGSSRLNRFIRSSWSGNEPVRRLERLKRLKRFERLKQLIVGTE